MKKHFVKLFFFCLIIAIFISGCAPSASRMAEGVIIEDMLGRKVTVPVEVERIVGVRSGALRQLVYMDAIDMIIGIEDGERRGTKPYITAHPQLQNLPVIGPNMGGDAEMLANAHPDVIFSAYTTIAEADDLQKKTGIPVIALECPEIATPARDSLYASLRLIGKILHKEARADSLIAYMSGLIQELDLRTSNIGDKERPSVYVGGVSYSGAKNIASTQPFYPPFIFTNSRNVTSMLNERLVSHVRGTYIDIEQLLLWNPDVIFLDESGINLVRNDLKQGGALYGGLKAVQNNRTYTVMPYNNYAVNYELVLINSWFVGKVLYPDAFADIDVKAKANEILEMFLGKPIFDELVTDNSFRQINKDEF